MTVGVETLPLGTNQRQGPARGYQLRVGRLFNGGASRD